jgi:hypothetical protein
MQGILLPNDPDSPLSSLPASRAATPGTPAFDDGPTSRPTAGGKTLPSPFDQHKSGGGGGCPPKKAQKRKRADGRSDVDGEGSGGVWEEARARGASDKDEDEDEVEVEGEDEVEVEAGGGEPKTGSNEKQEQKQKQDGKHDRNGKREGKGKDGKGKDGEGKDDPKGKDDRKGKQKQEEPESEDEIQLIAKPLPPGILEDIFNRCNISPTSSLLRTSISTSSGRRVMFDSSPNVTVYETTAITRRVS